MAGEKFIVLGKAMQIWLNSLNGKVSGWEGVEVVNLG